LHGSEDQVLLAGEVVEDGRGKDVADTHHLNQATNSPVECPNPLDVFRPKPTLNLLWALGG
ncbi:hypothetical protein ABT126_39115, partial [Streptomyces sp. NPDC002012]|uniref:hypothetical protein n=1 Tax=Streptomyces sp. NPDC002012 TaxID=3154532 RepID=UPI00331EB9A7